MESAVSEFGIVAAPHGLAVGSGVDVLAEGGNAFEAALAVAATIAVVYPHMNGIGGDSFWVVRQRNDRKLVLQAAGAAGSLVDRRAYLDRGHELMPLRGAEAAATVAGAVAGWQMVLEIAAAAGGRLALTRLLADAVRFAREGVPVSAAQGRGAPADFADIAAAPGFAEHFMADGKPLPAGAPLVQRRLADTLEQLGRAGLADFYRGDVARELAADLERIGAPVTRADLRGHATAIREPLAYRLREATTYVPPPPSQAIAELFILGMAEHLALGRPDEAAFIHGLVEATKRAYALRERLCADPAAGPPDPRPFLAAAAMEREAAMIDAGRAGPYPAAPVDGDTVWFGVVDAKGQAVSVCQSIFAEWGSGCVLPATGVLWHNRAAGFSLMTDSVRVLRPGRIPFHTLAPAMAEFHDGRLMAFGTMGADTQPQTVAALYTRYARCGQPLARAIDAPRWRFGQTRAEPKPTLKMEPRFDPSVVSALERMGHEIVTFERPYADETGHAGMIVRHPSGRIEGVHDPRADGSAAGP